MTITQTARTTNIAKAQAPKMRLRARLALRVATTIQAKQG